MMGTEPTRGERNNNPGNINEGGGWQGDIGLELVPDGDSYSPRFARFDTAENGIRAIAKQLLVYQYKHGLHTVRTMINRWAPPADDNDTDAYVAAVSVQVGVGPDDTIVLANDNDALPSMVYAIIHQENGRVLYDAATIDDACHDCFTPPA